MCPDWQRSCVKALNTWPATPHEITGSILWQISGMQLKECYFYVLQKDRLYKKVAHRTLLLNRQCPGLADHKLIHCHVFATLFSVTTVIDTSEWCLCCRAVTSILRWSAYQCNHGKRKSHQSNHPSFQVLKHPP
jgi:hypothetical protein